MAEGGPQEQTIVSGVAGRYATALFELATEAKTVDAVATDLDSFSAMIAESADLQRLIGSPAFSAQDQVAAVNALPGLLGALEKAEGHRDSLAATLVEVQREKLALERAIERVRELHTPGEEWCGYHNSALCECANVYCEDCGASWPCPTIQALDGGE